MRSNKLSIALKTGLTMVSLALFALDSLVGLLSVG